MVWRGVAWRGWNVAWRGMALHGEAWRGRLGYGVSVSVSASARVPSS